MKRNLSKLTAHGVFASDLPDHLFGGPFSPYGSVLCHATKQRPGFNLSGGGPAIDDGLHPVRNWHGSNMAAFAEQIDDSPVVIPVLDMFQGELSGFRAPQPAPEQERENGTISFAD